MVKVIWSKDYTSEVQVGPVQGPKVQVIWSKDYTDPRALFLEFSRCQDAEKSAIPSTFSKTI